MSSPSDGTGKPRSCVLKYRRAHVAYIYHTAATNVVLAEFCENFTNVRNEGMSRLASATLVSAGSVSSGKIHDSGSQPAGAIPT